MSRLRKYLVAVTVAIGFGLVALPASAVAASTAAPVVPPAAASSPVHAMVPSADVIAAGVDDFTFDSVHVDYELIPGEDGTGSLVVTETFVADFFNPDTNRGMRRIVPTTYNGAPLQPHLISITDGDGVARESETETEDGSYLMTSRAGGYVNGKQTYVFTYTLENVMVNYDAEDVDEFYWDVIGAEWAQPFGEVSMTLHIDPSLAAGLNGNASCYRGGSGSNEPCTLRSTADGMTWEFSGVALDRYQGVTIAIGFDEGTIVPFDGSYLSQDVTPVQLGVAGAGVAALIGAFVVRGTVMRDAKGRGIIVAQYEPPAGVDAMNAGVMLSSPHALTAEVLEQAVRGSIRIREGAGRTYVLELVDAQRAGDVNGAQLLSILFNGNTTPGTIVSNAPSSSRAIKLRALLSETKQAQLKGGVRRKPSRGWLIGFMLAVMAIFAAAIVTAISIVEASGNGLPIVVALAVGLVGVITIGLLTKRPYTALGADLRDHLKGLKVFMNWAEADRIRMLQSPEGAERVRVNTQDPASMLKLYEPLLPFAVVFGIDKQWTKAMQVYYDAGGYQPYWYSGNTTFTVAALSSTVQGFTPASSSSSSSSGSGGGGSVGGGGGGGGGGGV